MLGLAKSTEYNKRIPKKTFYEKIEISSVLKKNFTEQIKIIYWRNKIAAEIVNLTKGKNVLEVEVFEIKLNTEVFDADILRQIDKILPYHIVFLLEYEGKYQAWISYKEIEDDKIKVNQYFHTKWLNEESLPCKMEGFDMDSIYENFVRQIAGDKLEHKEGNSLKEDILRAEAKKKLTGQINALQTKVRKEKQFNKKVEMNKKLKELKIVYNEI